MEPGAGVLGADDHAVDPRRPRGLPAGRRRRREGRRRRRHPHPRHRGHLPGHLLGQRPGDGGPLQRRPLRRGRVPGLRRGVARDPRRGHRPRVGSLRRLRRRLLAVHVHQRLHDRLRRAAHPRRHPAARGGRGLRARRGPRRRPARQLGAEPDPRLRAARHRRPGHADAPLPGPARDDAVDDDPRLPQRGRLRLVPRRRPAPLRPGRPGAAAPQDRRPPRHRRRPPGRDHRLPGEGRRRRRLPRRHARDAGRRRDRRPHRRRVRARSRCRSRS